MTLELSFSMDFSWTSLVSKLSANIPSLFHVHDHANFNDCKEGKFGGESYMTTKTQKVCDGVFISSYVDSFEVHVDYSKLPMYDEYNDKYSLVGLNSRSSYNYNTFPTNKHNEHDYITNMTLLSNNEILYDNYAQDNVIIHGNIRELNLLFILTNMRLFILPYIHKLSNNIFQTTHDYINDSSSCCYKHEFKKGLS